MLNVEKGEVGVQSMSFLQMSLMEMTPMTIDVDLPYYTCFEISFFSI